MANIIRRDPFVELTSLQDRVNRLFNQAFGGFEGVGIEQPFTSAEIVPPIDIVEGEEKIVLVAEVPGVKPEDLVVTLENNILTITGERKLKEVEEERENLLRVERRFGKFARSFTLPAAVDPEKVVATFENGLLHHHAGQAGGVQAETNQHRRYQGPGHSGQARQSNRCIVTPRHVNTPTRTKSKNGARWGILRRHTDKSAR
jgi:HSP20 family protein